jgi:membrane protein required for colicin V production
MTFPEYIVIGATVFGAVIGYFKGFLKQVSSLLGLLVGYVVAVVFLSPAHVLLIEKGIVSEKSSLWLSFFIIVLIVFLSVRFLSRLIESGLQYIGLGFTNRIAGMFSGAIKYFLFIMILFCFLEVLGIVSEKNSSPNLLNFISLFKILLFRYNHD